MSRKFYEYTKMVLERVSFDSILFEKELKKATSNLLPSEIELLNNWLIDFTNEKPELKKCLMFVEEEVVK